MTPAKITELFERFKKENPHPKIELDYTNPYTLMVAVILSAQATDKGVNKATPSLFEKVDTPQKMLKLGEEGLKTYIKSINFYNNKAKNIIAMSQALVDRHQGQIPSTRDALEKLPGVARKSANVMLNVVFGESVIAVDTHIFRVADRLGLSHAPTPEKVSDELEKIVPSEYRHEAHHWLVLHGRYICQAKKPKCPECLVRDLCPWTHKTKGS